MTPSRHDRGVGRPGAGPVESIGALLVRVRTQMGQSQLRVAEQLCAASGNPTVTRHEVSRWERETRLPSGVWLRWLAAVLEVPLDELERATARARELRRGRVGRFRDAPAAGTLAGPVGAAPGELDDAALLAVADRVRALRRMDDLVGGADLAGVVDQELRRGLALTRRDLAPRVRRRLLPLVAELAQLAGWVAADAGVPVTAGRAHRIGVRVATEAGDNALAGHLLASLAHLGAADNPAGCYALARRAHTRARATASATTRSLLLHRVAFTAARAGERRACERALLSAEQMYDRRDPARDPHWVYWFDDVELGAMTGRCYAALGRPRLAEPLLRDALDSGRIRLRPWALYAAWLASVQLDAGDVEQASAIAGQALLTAVRVGSVRALHQVVALHPRLAAHRGSPAVRSYAELVHATRPYLPGSVAAGSGPGSGKAGPLGIASG